MKYKLLQVIRYFSVKAALGWMEIQARYEDRELVSPATAGVDTEWMDQFMVECELLGCRFDYLATHWYGNSHGVSAEYTINVSMVRIRQRGLYW